MMKLFAVLLAAFATLAQGQDAAGAVNQEAFWGRPTVCPPCRCPQPPPPCRTIAEIAISTPSLSTLVAAVVAANLTDALNGTTPLTVFAPTNAAFAALPAGTVQSLLNDIPALTNVLTYHVTAGAVFSNQLRNGQRITMLNGAQTTVILGRTGGYGKPWTTVVQILGGIPGNRATVVSPNIRACNGVIHVINAVLLPPPPTAG